MYPSNLRYTKDHEWVRFEGGEALVGITDFAQEQLGDIVFVDVTSLGHTVAQGEIFGEVQSVKAVSELFSPVSGEVIAVNHDIVKRNPDDAVHPELVNKQPHDTWIVRLRPTATEEADRLLDAAAYAALVR